MRICSTVDLCGRRGAQLPHLREVPHGDRRAQDVGTLGVTLALAEGDDIAVMHVRSEAVDICQPVGSPTRDEGEILAGGGLDVRRVARVPEVEVTVDVREPELPATTEREHVTHQDAAVPAEDEGESPRLQHRPDLPGEIQGKGADGLGVARAVAWVPLRRVGRRCHQSAIDGTEALDDALVTQCPRESGHSGLPTGGGGPQPQIGGGVDHLNELWPLVLRGHPNLLSHAGQICLHHQRNGPSRFT